MVVHFVNVGIDMIEIDRIKKSMNRKNFLNVILGKDEYKQLSERNFPIQSVAANFCAKEAFSKAVGTGIRGFGFKDVQLLRNDIGKPYLLINENVIDKLSISEFKFDVSITHTKNYAAAVVVCDKER